MAVTRSSRPRRRDRLSGDELIRRLTPIATTRERVEAILAIGVNAGELADLTGTTESGVRHWLSGNTEPRPDAAMALDYVRAVLKALLDGGMEPERALRWLMSLDPERFGQERPFDVLRTSPMRVLTAALELGLDAGAIV